MSSMIQVQLDEDGGYREDYLCTASWRLTKIKLLFQFLPLLNRLAAFHKICKFNEGKNYLIKLKEMAAFIVAQFLKFLN